MPAPELAANDVRLAALLRGVNVGGRTIPMYELRDVVGTLDVRNVRTVLASGNVLLDASAATPVGTTRARLEQAIGARFGYEALVALVPLTLVGELVAGAPWPDDDLWHTYVAFSTTPGLLREATAATEEEVTADAAAADAGATAAEAAARVTELRERTGRTEVCSVVAASFLVAGPSATSSATTSSSAGSTRTRPSRPVSPRSASTHCGGAARAARRSRPRSPARSPVRASRRRPPAT